MGGCANKQKRYRPSSLPPSLPPSLSPSLLTSSPVVSASTAMISEATVMSKPEKRGREGRREGRKMSKLSGRLTPPRRRTSPLPLPPPSFSPTNRRRNQGGRGEGSEDVYVLLLTCRAGVPLLVGPLPHRHSPQVPVTHVQHALPGDGRRIDVQAGESTHFLREEGREGGREGRREGGREGGHSGERK